MRSIELQLRGKYRAIDLTDMSEWRLGSRSIPPALPSLPTRLAI